MQKLITYSICCGFTIWAAGFVGIMLTGLFDKGSSLQLACAAVSGGGFLLAGIGGLISLVRDLRAVKQESPVHRSARWPQSP